LTGNSEIDVVIEMEKSNIPFKSDLTSEEVSEIEKEIHFRLDPVVKRIESDIDSILKKYKK
jgi:hypothetical protein